jgi:hypothetical protein
MTAKPPRYAPCDAEPKRRGRKSVGVGAHSVWALAVLTALAAQSLGVPRAVADPNDGAYLAALNHGGLCCPEQVDTPISYADPTTEISDAQWISTTMRETASSGNDTYAGFKVLSHTIFRNSNSPGKVRPLNPFQSGELVVIAVHYYAGSAIECALIKQMVGDANYWYGRPKAIAPGAPDIWA